MPSSIRRVPRVGPVRHRLPGRLLEGSSNRPPREMAAARPAQPAGTEPGLQARFGLLLLAADLFLAGGGETADGGGAVDTIGVGPTVAVGIASRTRPVAHAGRATKNRAADRSRRGAGPCVPKMLHFSDSIFRSGSGRGRLNTSAAALARRRRPLWAAREQARRERDHGPDDRDVHR